MGAIHLKGRITESGKLEIELPANIPPGTVHVTIEAIDPDQAWFWTEEWQSGEKQADEDIAAGRYKAFNDMDSLIADLMNDDED